MRSGVPKFDFSDKLFPLCKFRFEEFARQVGCPPVCHRNVDAIKVGAPDFNGNFVACAFGVPVVESKMTNLASTCLVENVSKTDIFTKIFRLQSPSAGWKILVDRYLPKSISVTEAWAEQFENIAMPRGEEPMNYFARVDEITRVLDYFGVVKPENEFVRKMV